VPPGKRLELDKGSDPIDTLIDKSEKRNSGIRAKVERPYMNAPGLPCSQFMTTKGKDCYRRSGLLQWGYHLSLMEFAG
jgi:hypothetical protein